MKINTKGFSLIEFVMIVIVLVIVGTFVYFASKSEKVQVSNNTLSATSPNGPVNYDQKFVINLVRQIASDAETKYTGNYSKAFKPANSLRDNGAGMLADGGSLYAKLIADMSLVGGKVFAITNDRVSAYVLYGSLPNTNNTSYYCLGSDGSTKDYTGTVADSASLSKKPYCK